jgi:hypothetical protein
MIEGYRSACIDNFNHKNRRDGLDKTTKIGSYIVKI